MQKFKIIITFSLFFLTSCSYVSLDRLSVKQGNVISDASLKSLKIGMDKNEVASLIGNSLVNSPFTDERWDYVYLWGNTMNKIERKNISLYFSKGSLARIEEQTPLKG